MRKDTEVRLLEYSKDTPIPNRIKEILKSRKVAKLYPSSYTTLAMAAKVARNTVVHLACGRYFPKLDNAYKIARALNCTVYDIWGEMDTIGFLDDLEDELVNAMMSLLEEEEDEV
jgi:DNA-binding XRE family transcriptional regulator